MSEDLEYYKAKYQTLEDLPGIGPATVAKLKEVGFKTVESLGTAAVAELVAAGIGEPVAEKVIDAARKSMAPSRRTMAGTRAVTSEDSPSAMG